MSRQPLLDLAITAIGARGDGLALADGQRVFVPFTVPGDRIRARPIGRADEEGLRAEMVERIASGPDRVSPACAHFGLCGGCGLQHLADEAYAGWKTGLVRGALERAGLGGTELAPLARTPAGGRRRARFAAQRHGGRFRLGFNERQSRRLVTVTECPVLRPELRSVLPALGAVLAGVLADGAQMDIAATWFEGGLDLVLIGPRRLDRTARERLAAFAEDSAVARLSWRPDERSATEPLAHRLPVFARFGDALVVPPPGAFLQASAEGEAALVAEVRSCVTGAARVADLFAGLGTFSLPVAAGGASVHAVESDAEAVAALARAAHGRRLTTERRDLFDTPLTARELARFDAVVFDPPRAGAPAQAAEIAASGVPVVVGVSCNPATFARDARRLVEGGYRLVRVQPVDQFLWTTHVELVGQFLRDS